MSTLDCPRQNSPTLTSSAFTGLVATTLRAAAEAWKERVWRSDRCRLFLSMTITNSGQSRASHIHSNLYAYKTPKGSRSNPDLLSRFRGGGGVRGLSGIGVGFGGRRIADDVGGGIRGSDADGSESEKLERAFQGA
ncbi:hypothetical protein HMN09_00071000 [Mycena chlorophos]|uniref:Uncharacterized protein n=1 Tax=Mycena chlorophos TaxID=658473 RepID=A0A8H6TWA7_MYCCL|nr:hypothetical protein HMN09_00071000 [Mycena chlorophos]